MRFETVYESRLYALALEALGSGVGTYEVRDAVNQAVNEFLMPDEDAMFTPQEALEEEEEDPRAGHNRCPVRE